MLSDAIKELITLIPREGTETMKERCSRISLVSVDYPYSPRGDGNRQSIFNVCQGFKS